jgi:hypothetical protein
MSHALVPAGHTHTLEDDPLLQRLAELYNDPVIEKEVNNLRRKIIDKLLSSSEDLYGVDMNSEDGTYVHDGIKERLLKAREDLASVSIEMTIGGVQITDGKDMLRTGIITIPFHSSWAQQRFANRNPLEAVNQFVFTAYKTSGWVLPRNVDENSTGPEFTLNYREEIAAQILMVVNAALTYRNLAYLALNEDLPRGHAEVKSQENMQDLREALQYAVQLKDALLPTSHQQDMIQGMSASAERFIDLTDGKGG